MRYLPLAVSLGLAACCAPALAQGSEASGPRFGVSSSVASSSSVKARLRRQLLELVPQLRQGGHFPEGADMLALPMAQLGDADAARRLATKPWTRETIVLWRAQQLALRHQWVAALPVAQRLTDPGTRADTLLIIARLAIQEGEIEAAKPSLLAAMRVLDKSPDSAQLAYAGWLWAQCGGRESARRVLWQKAWPRALKENEAQKKERQSWSGWQPHNESQVINFASMLGLTSDIVRMTKPQFSPEISWVLSRVNSRSDIGLLREWLEQAGPLPPSYLLTLALSAAQLGMKEEAHLLRDEAQPLIEKLPVDPRGERAISLIMNVALASVLGDQVELSRLEQGVASAGSLTLDDLRSTILFFRLRVPNNNLGGEPRFDLSHAELEDTANQVLALQPSAAQLDALNVLARIYQRRHNNERWSAITEAAVRCIQVQGEKAEEDRRNNHSFTWTGESVPLAKTICDARPGAEQPLLDAMVKYTPLPFQPWMAEQLYKNGFKQAARQIFDPIQKLQREATLSQAIAAERNPKKRQALERTQITLNLDNFAAAQVRFDNPDAPAAWFEKVPDENSRIAILRAWAGAFYPQIELKPPYVRRVGDSRTYQVGGSAGASVG